MTLEAIPARRFVLVSLTALAFLAIPGVPRADAQCVRAEMSGLPTGPGWNEIALGNIDTFGLDLRIGIQGPPTPAVLELVDGQGVLVIDQDIDPTTHSQEIRLNGALAELPERGLQFRVRLVHSTTGSLLLDEPLRFGLDCPSANACQWQAEPRIHSDGPVADSELVDVLRSLLEAGVDNPYEVLLAEYPELHPSLFELLFQTQDLDASPDADPSLDAGGRPVGCQCDWIGSYTLGFAPPTGGFTGQPPLHVHSMWAGSLGFWAAQVTADAHSNPLPATGTRVGLELICAEHLGSRTYTFTLPAGRKLEVPIPIVSMCPPPCQGEISHRVGMDLCVSATGYARSDSRIEADLALSASAWVDGTRLFDQPVAVQLDTTSAGGDDRSAFASPAASTLVHGTASALTLLHHGSVDLRITGPSALGPTPYLYADASTWPTAFVTGEATCTAQHRRELIIGGGSSGGGSVIERWGDPP